MATSADDRNIGTLIERRYLLAEVLGHGSFATVFRADDVRMRRSVAVKVLHATHAGDPDLLRRFEREALRSSQLRHPNNIQVFDYGQLETGAPYLVMEHLQGRTLEAELEDGLPMSPAHAVSALRQILSALSEAHASHLIHRDLKPANIFLAKIAGTPDVVKLLDYGVAKSTSNESRTLTQDGLIVGSVAYMSPEQCHGKTLDTRSDLYSVGCIAYEMLTGGLVFDAEDAMSMMLAHVQTPPVDVRDATDVYVIPDRLAAIVMRLLSKKRSDRFADARQVIVALEQLGTPKEPAPAAQSPAHARPAS